MEKRELVKTAFHSLRVNLLRSTLSATGVVMAVAIVIVLISMGSGVRAEIISQVQSLGSNLLIVRPGAEESSGSTAGLSSTQLSLSTVTEDDVKKLKGQSDVALCSGGIEGAAQVAAGAVNVNAQLFGVDGDFWKMRDIKMSHGGTLPGETGNCVLGGYLSGKMFPGDKEGGVGQTVTVGQSTFKVVGVARHRPKSMIGDPNREMYVSLADARALFGGVDAQVSRISVGVAEGKDIKAVKEDIKATLKPAHAGREDFNVVSQEDLVASYDKIMSLLNALVVGIAGAALVVGGIGIANIMYISVKERTSEIGILMAQGATKSDIIKQFLTESIILCALGGVVGVPLGIGISWLIDKYTVMSCRTPAWVAVVSLLAAVVVGVLAGVFPARQATRIDIGEALRKE